MERQCSLLRLPLRRHRQPSSRLLSPSRRVRAAVVKVEGRTTQAMNSGSRDGVAGARAEVAAGRAASGRVISGTVGDGREAIAEIGRIIRTALQCV